ncbi:MAG: C1 family peptidase [Levilactobacillus sp.]|jgi:aminopeptidase C|uniref:C1 family peptidase n=1 Tax=Levilactobacillus sp. TaxID=2767919 RepID=UPI0025884DA0|nr:C1 family peptidase [Levilactobacillus sp.]MCI1554423.1 C1 family peptidase [Levilactobacillus sp.]MCI1598246.1 C1 family peptidase [Levilactobacillus sp.]MCI1605905.1 C1 family peptidase [Levilactobacillus sp.]
MPETKLDHELTTTEIAALQADLQAQPAHQVISRATIKNGVLAASEDPQAAVRLNRTFSVELPTGKVANQKHSGRCWLFATLNVIRHQFAAKYHVKDFELSQNYLFFWDRVERANIFYDRILRTADRPLDDREVADILESPDDDGGQWAMGAALVQKYGVVPTSAMPESFNSNDTTGIGAALNLKLRKDALALRQLVADGADEAKIATTRAQALKEVYRMAAYAFGEPPATFDLEFKDDDHKLHRAAGLTPQGFFHDYFDVDLDDYVVVSNSPDKAFDRQYRLASEENIVGGKHITFLNLPLADMKRAAVAQLQSGEAVWFGNDVLQQMSRERGFLDSHLFQVSDLFGVDLSLTKAQRLATGEASVSHAMTLTGVNLVDDQPNRWKVENSWGEKNGDKGYFVMTDEWLDDFVYEVVVHKRFLTPAQRELLNTEPHELAPWDSLS